MAKDEGSTTLKSISNSARTLSARLARRTRVAHGGTCSACGLKSTSCTTGSKHDACPGFYTGSFEDATLDAIQAKALAGDDFRVLFNGNRVSEKQPGLWTDPASISIQRQAAKDVWHAEQRARIVLTSVFEVQRAEDQDGAYEFDKCVNVLATNGLGESMEYIFGAWRPL